MKGSLSFDNNEEVRYIKEYGNGLVEHYINRHNRFYTINGKRIHGYRIIYYDKNYFLLQDSVSMKQHNNCTEIKFYISATLYDYSGKTIIQGNIEVGKEKGSIKTFDLDSVKLEDMKDKEKLLRELNDSVKVFFKKYLYSKESKKMLKLRSEESVSLEEENVIITFPEGEKIRLNSKLEQIDSEDGIVYIGEYL